MARGGIVPAMLTVTLIVRFLLELAAVAALALAALRGPTQATAFIAVVALDAGLMAALEN